MYRTTILISGLVACLALGMTPALAGHGGGHSGINTDPSIALNETDPHLGGTVTFTVVYPSSVKDPRVQVTCYQAGVIVYTEAGTFDHAFLLGGASSDWLTLGGPASCTGELFYFIWHGNNQQVFVSLATTTFDAAG